MQEQNARIAKIVIGKKTAVAFVALGICLAVLAAVLTAVDYESSVGFFRYGSIGAIVLKICLGVSCALSAVWLVATPDVQVSKQPIVWPCRITYGILAVVSLIFASVSLIFSTSLLSRLAPLFLLLGAVGFLLRALLTKTIWCEILAFAPLLFLNVYLVSAYMDMTEPLYGDFRLLRLLAIVSVVLCMLSDVRHSVGILSAKLTFIATAISLVFVPSFAAMSIVLFSELSLPMLLLALFLFVYTVANTAFVWYTYFAESGVEKETEDIHA